MTTPSIKKPIFGAGRNFANLNATVSTPIRFGIVQDQTLSFKRKVEELFGENQLAEDVSSGSMSVTGKVTAGTNNPRVPMDLLFAATGAAGQTVEADNEQGTVASHAIQVVNHTTFLADKGVVNATSGLRYVCVAAGSEVAGSAYSQANGTYTFASGETGTNFLISYLYTNSASGESFTAGNVKQGKVGNFTSVMIFPWTPTGGTELQDVMQLNSCLLTDHEMSTKEGSYGKPPTGFTAGCDANGNLGVLSFAVAA